MAPRGVWLVGLALVSCDEQRTAAQPSPPRSSVTAEPPRVVQRPSAAPAPSASPACLPQSGAPLAEDARFSAAELPAIQAARAELRRVLLAPEAFVASVTLTDELAIVELATPGACGDGRARTLTYDRRTRRVVATKIWQ